MVTGSASVESLRGALLRLADHHDVDGTALAHVWALAGAEGFAPNAAPSSICTDGTPFEIGVCLGTDRGGLRYLAEIGDGRPAWRRLLNARQRLPALLSVLDLPAAPFLQRVDAFLPRRPRDFPELIFGLWVCPVLRARSRELKVYLNTSWWEVDTLWTQLHHVVDHADSCDVHGLLEGLRRTLQPSRWSCFVCFETSTTGAVRTKLYFRGGPVSLDLVRSLANKGVEAPPAWLWKRLLSTPSLGSEDAVLCVSLPSRDRPPGLKVDFVAKLLGSEEAAIGERVEKVAEDEKLDLADYRATLDAFHAEGVPVRHTVVGLSVRHERPRVSVYLRPFLRDPASLLRVMSAVTSPARAIARPSGSRVT